MYIKQDKFSRTASAFTPCPSPIDSFHPQHSSPLTAPIRSLTLPRVQYHDHLCGQRRLPIGGLREGEQEDTCRMG